MPDPVNINASVMPLPLSSPATVSGSVWLGQLVVYPPGNGVNTAFYQAYFPAPFGSTTAPVPANVTIAATTTNHPPFAPSYPGYYSAGGGWSAVAIMGPPANVEMAFTISKGLGQTWPSPMLISIQIINGSR